MNKSVAIIGGNGFIGKNLTQYLAERGYDVIVLGHGSALADYQNVQYFSEDTHHTKALVEKAKNVENVIWLVHASVPSTEDESLIDDYALNISPIIRFLEKADHLPNLKKFIYLSSGGTIYGDAKDNLPIKESFPQQPISAYGLSKSIAEKYIEFLTRNRSFESVILRPSNVYGPFQNLVKPQGIIGFAFKALKNNLTLDLYDGGKVVRDFIYVEDLAEAVEKCIVFPLEIGKSKAYNVGSNEGISIIDILQKIQEVAGKELVLNHKSSRNFDCQYSVLDTSEFSEKYDWKKTTDLNDGLRNVWDWIQKEV